MRQIQKITVFGMGVGATDEVRDLAIIGRFTLIFKN